MSEFVMHGPAEFEMKVWVVNDENGQVGSVTVSLGAFEYPTRRKVAKRMDSVLEELEENGVTGFRLATKEESFRAWSNERVGEPLALAGGPYWDEI